MLKEMQTKYDNFYLLNPLYNLSHGSVTVNYDAKVYNNIIFKGNDIFPVLYLNNNIKISVGDGSLSNPYRISI